MIGSSEYVFGTAAGCQHWKAVKTGWMKIVCLFSKLKTLASFSAAFSNGFTTHTLFLSDQAPGIKQQTLTEKPLNLDPTEASVNELHRLGYGEVESNGDGDEEA